MAHSHDVPSDLTRNQGLVLGALNHSVSPLSAYDILDQLRADGLRALHARSDRQGPRNSGSETTLPSFVPARERRCPGELRVRSSVV